MSVHDDPVSTMNGNSSPLSNRIVTNSQPPRPASSFMITSAGNSDAGIIADGSGVVAQEQRSSRLKNMPNVRGSRVVLISDPVSAERIQIRVCRTEFDLDRASRVP